MLRSFRDEVLSKIPKGRRYIELFYKHAEEAVEILYCYPELLSTTNSLLQKFLPTTLSIVNGRSETINTEDLVDVELLIEAFAEKASPELRNDLMALKNDLRQGILQRFNIRIKRLK